MEKKEIDFEKLSKDYMTKYYELIAKSQTQKTKQIIEDINSAIEERNLERINQDYSKILEWNFYVGNIEGARKAIHSQFSFLHLPSVATFSIIFDENEKIWKFNTN